MAFDIAQFFPSINHEMLLAVLAKSGFSPRVVKFFGSYLRGRFTRYAWGSFLSDPLQADVGVGQGSALSPVLSAIILAPLMYLFDKRARGLDINILSYVDNGTLIAQSPSLGDNCAALVKAYALI